MVYTTVPFSLKHIKGNAFVYCTKGIFMVDDPGMIELLKWISRTDFVEHEDIITFWKKTESQNASIDDAISYLTEDLQVLIALQPGFMKSTPYFVSSGAMPVIVINSLFKPCECLSYDEFFITDKTRAGSLFIVEMTEGLSSEKIEKFLDTMDNQSITIFIFQVGDHFVISHAYMKRFLSPCILCLYDYVMEKVFSDRKQSINSLASVVDYINDNYNISAPQIKTEDLDLYYLMRELKQSLLPLTGRGRFALSGGDPGQTKIINIHTLDKSTLTVPFSPRCDCMQKYHSNKGYQNA